jgi:transposase
MARRTFHVIDITEILVHWYAGRSQYELADSLGVDRKTIRKYLEPAIAAGFVPPGPPPMSEVDWAELVREWFPLLTDTRLRQVTWPEIARHREFIVVQLEAGVSKATIHQRLADEHGLTASLASLKRYVAANLPESALRSRVTVLRPESPPPGEEAQIDYGLLGTWTDPRTGKRHRVQAFVMVLSHSRHMFVRPVLVMDQQAWTEAHVAAFAFFGGAPARLVPDNLRTGVDKPDLYDPKMNRSYAELASRYGVLVDPARAGKPKDKPRVERPMPYVRDSFWRGREFTSLDHMQAAALSWCAEVAGARRCRPLDGAAPAAVFAAAEAETLRPLPPTPFVLATWSRAKVGPDIHVKAGRALYSVPWRLIGQHVDVRSTALVVQIFHSGELVKTHARAERGKRTDLADYPPEKIAFHMRTPAWCRAQAERIGPATTQVIAGLLEVNALYRLRSAQGVLGLEAKHGAARVEAGCTRAIAVGDPSYRTIKGVLAAGTEAEPAAPRTGDGGAAAFLHGPSQLFADVVPLPATSPAAAAGLESQSSPATRDADVIPLASPSGAGPRRTAPREPGQAANTAEEEGIGS